jgi:hypothetical protein
VAVKGFLVFAASACSYLYRKRREEADEDDCFEPNEPLPVDPLE